MKNRADKRKKKDPYASQRRSWGNLNPATRVHQDKKTYKRNKRVEEEEL